MSNGFTGGGTTGGKWGCAFAALVGIPLIGGAILIGAMGDCAPDTTCSHNLDWQLMLVALVVAAVVGFGSRALINWLLTRRSTDR